MFIRLTDTAALIVIIPNGPMEMDSGFEQRIIIICTSTLVSFSFSEYQLLL